ncbi:MAG: RNA polymerase sigma factor [Clostridia bacterium]|nr:RNA polymerase sigma factor [Clostridia bacterium]MBR5767766.1 RNA polymerase sigma factor [Clostridia bacterium]
MGAFESAALGAALKKIASGDMSGIDLIYDRLGRQIYTLVLSVVGNETDAEDAMQGTFIKIMNSAGTFAETRGSAKTWILSVARHAAFDLLKKKERSRVEELGEDVPDTDGYSGVEDRDEAERILGVLDETERQIVVLRAAERLKFKEIAAIIGRSEERTRKKYAEAIEKIRENRKTGGLK